MLYSRDEEFLRATWRGIKALAPLLFMTFVMPFAFAFVFYFLNRINTQIGNPLFEPNHLIFIPIAILCWFMASTGIIATVHQIKNRMKMYDEHANKEWTEKDLDEWCYCGLSKDGKFIQHKRLIHKNDPKFFIQ